MSRLADMGRLITERLGQVAMAGLHFVARAVVLRLPGLMSGDFGGPRALVAAALQMILNLLAAWA